MNASLRPLMLAALMASAAALPAIDRWPVGGDPATTDTMRTLLRLPEGQDPQPAGATAAAIGQDAAFTTGDGMELAATWYGVAGVADPPVAIVLHELNGSRGDAAGLADELVRRGVAVLALDLRGHGGSSTQQGVSGEVRAIQFATDPASPRWGEMARDIEAAVVWVRGHRLTNNPRIVVIGSREGGGAAAAAEARLTKEVAGLVLISPELNMGGFRLLKTLPAAQTPYLVIASELHSRARNVIVQLTELSTTLQSRVYPGGERGFLLATHEDVAEAIAQFAQTGTLPPPPVAPAVEEGTTAAPATEETPPAQEAMEEEKPEESPETEGTPPAPDPAAEQPVAPADDAPPAPTAS